MTIDPVMVYFANMPMMAKSVSTLASIQVQWCGMAEVFWHGEGQVWMVYSCMILGE